MEKTNVEMASLMKEKRVSPVQKMQDVVKAHSVVQMERAQKTVTSTQNVTTMVRVTMVRVVLAQTVTVNKTVVKKA